MPECNSLNPYALVKGVLLDYRIKKMGLEMHFVAKSLKTVEVPESSFEIHSSMKPHLFKVSFSETLSCHKKQRLLFLILIIFYTLAAYHFVDF